MKIGLFASGSLGYNCITQLGENVSIAFIATDSQSTDIINYAKTSNIQLFAGNPRKKDFMSFSTDINVEFSLSINYLFLLNTEIIDRLGKIVNFHGSLLPKYRGRTPHVWAIINNEQKTGITAHFIDAGCDTGDIILQKTVEINPNDTGADILDKYKLLYPEMINSIISAFSSNSVNRITQDASQATYFGKRTPEDGNINWNWHKERIYNWVRAQADPYPGAFTFFNGNKVVIDKIEYHNHGYDQNDPNGMIVAFEEEIPLVKTPNGVVSLSVIRNKNIIQSLQVGKTLTS